MGMAYDGREVVEEGGRVMIAGLPYETGSEVDVHVSLAPNRSNDVGPVEMSAEAWIERMRRVAREIHESHPNAPILTEHEMSRESIYEDEQGL